MAHPKIKFALLGCGYWGRNFLRVITNSDSAILKCICDLDPDILRSLADKHPNTILTDDVEQIISDPEIEAVIVCTPVNTHFALTERLLLSGKHVLCEKPLSNIASQCEQLYQLAQKQNKILLTGHVFEYNAVVQYMKKLIANKEIGDVMYLQLTRMGLGPVRSDVSVVFDLAAHDVSIAISLMSQMPISVSASGSSFLQSHLEDIAFIQMEFPGRVLAGISVSWLDPIKQRLVKIVGSKKMLLFDDVSISEKLKIIDTGKNYQTSSGDFGSFQLSIKDGQIVIPNIPHPEPLITEFEHFADCIRGTGKPLTDAHYAAQVVKVLEAAQKSISSSGAKIMLS